MNTQTDSIKNLLLSTLTQAAGSKSGDLALVRRPPPGAHVPATLPPSSLPAVTVSPAPLLPGRPRTGAIASLPKDKRDLVCRMIANGVVYKKIAQALDQLGFVVTERNISNWVTHGGYAEWCALYQDALQTTLRQDALLQYHRSDNSPDLAEVGLQSAAVRLSEFLLRQAAPSQDAEPNLSKLEPVVTLLCRINKELLTVQKYRDDCQTKAYRTPARIKNTAHDKLVEIEAKYSAGARPKLLDSADPDTAPQPPVTQTSESAVSPTSESAPTAANSAPAGVPAPSTADQPQPTAGSSPAPAPEAPPPAPISESAK